MTGLSVSESVERALEQIDRTEPAIDAWVVVDRKGARNQAHAIDQRLSGGENLPLAGLTVGVKDIFDVAGLPTVGGFTPFEGTIAGSDSAVAASLRRGGAVILGKTTTTQFAVADPTTTRNPWNLDRTPGGSSSGSAAAVVAGHVDLAIGSQTGGSTLRPAAYCGVVGFKPGFGWTSRSGMLPLAASLDTVGLIGRDVATIARTYDVLADASLDRVGHIDAMIPRRVGIWQDACDLAEHDMRTALDDTLERFRASGVECMHTNHTVAYLDMLAVHTVVMMTEAAATHRRLIERHADAYAPRIRASIETGMVIPAHAYARCRVLRDEFLATIRGIWADLDAVVFPTVVAGAPTRETTGNTSLQAVVSLLGLPSITFPIGLDRDGMPLGLQMVSPHANGNANLLRFAAWAESTLPRLPQPPLAAASNS